MRKNLTTNKASFLKRKVCHVCGVCVCVHTHIYIYMWPHIVLHVVMYVPHIYIYVCMYVHTCMYHVHVYYI